jgi:hypothetical protein
LQDQLKRLEEADDLDGVAKLLREVQEMGVTDESDRALIQELMDIIAIYLELIIYLGNYYLLRT